MKTRLLAWFVLILLLFGCSEKQNEDLNNGMGDESVEINDNTVINDDALKVEETEDDGSKRVFIDLEYLGVVEDVDLSAWYTYYFINESTEFTWWVKLSIPESYIVSDIYNINWDTYKVFDFHVPQEIDRTQKDVIVSYGRKLRYLYYDFSDIGAETVVGSEGCYGRPVFEREYSHNTAYIYLIDKIQLKDNEMYGTDLEDFNEKGIIPFELPPEE
jgi:hypothetical protein